MHRVTPTLTPSARLRIQIVVVETVLFLNFVQEISYGDHFLLVDRLAGDVREIEKFKVHCAEFGENRAARGCPVVVLGIACERRERKHRVSHDELEKHYSSLFYLW